MILIVQCFGGELLYWLHVVLIYHCENNKIIDQGELFSNEQSQQSSPPKSVKSLIDKVQF